MANFWEDTLNLKLNFKTEIISINVSFANLTRNL